MKLSHRAGSHARFFVRASIVVSACAASALAQQPDLVVNSVDLGAATGNWQSLALGGSVDVEVENLGLGAASSPFDVLLFEDRNANGTYDLALDLTLGTGNLGALASGANALLSIPVFGTITFRGNLVYAFVDSSAAITETDEGNNSGNSGTSCSNTPVPGPIQPVLEWSWTSSLIEPTSLNVMMTPSVVDLEGDGVPEVIYASTVSTGGGFVEVGVLRALRGDTGAEVFTVTDPTLLVNTASSVAVGDIDNDGRPEILACDNTGARLICFEHDGTFKWRSTTLEVINWGAPSIADLNEDGSPEIVIGRQALDAAGNLLWTGTGGRGGDSVGPISVVSDVDNDGDLDVVAGNTVYSGSGAILFQNTAIPDSLPAVANFDADTQAEIVTVIGGVVRLIDLGPGASLTVLASASILGGGAGGPPTIADYDADGFPEIGVAGATRYIVYEYDGSATLQQKWDAVIQDSSSNRTGSSVFDFNGDGAAEVVYRDELFLRVYRGTDGVVLFTTEMSSCTWYEYVLVADVDADGNAEIVACANNNCGFGPQRGIFVFGDPNDNWVATRRVWNQHSYHITNVDEDGGIPQNELANWLTPPSSPFNSFRQNTLSTLNPTAAPDLTASFLRATSSPTSTLTARIGNGGAVVVGAGLAVSFYDGDPSGSGNLLGTATTTTPLDPGEYEDVTLALVAAPPGVAWVAADDAGGLVGAQNECDETNNVHNAAVLLDLVCPADVIEIWTIGTPGQVDPTLTGTATWVNSCDPNAQLTHSDSYEPGDAPGEPEVIVTRTWTLTDSCGNQLTCQQLITLLSPSGAGAVMLDIQPQACPNLVPLTGDGNTVFVLAGTGVVDVALIDLASLRISRTDVAGKALGAFWSGELDRATPYSGVAGGCHMLGADGVMDIVIEASDQALRRRLGLWVEGPGTLIPIVVRGQLLDGTPIEARDMILLTD